MVGKRDQILHLLKNLRARNKYASFLAAKLNTSLQYTCQLLNQLKLQGKIKVIEKPFDIGSGGRNLKIYYDIRETALEEVKQVLGLKKRK